MGALWNVVYPSLVGRHRYRLEDGRKGTFGRAEGARDGASDTSTASGASSGLLNVSVFGDRSIAHDDKEVTYGVDGGVDSSCYAACVGDRVCCCVQMVSNRKSTKRAGNTYQRLPERQRRDSQRRRDQVRLHILLNGNY